MAISQRLDLRQSQSLVMTPQLQQAIKLLQMSAHELQAFVAQEMESNPLLERAEGGEDAPLPDAGQDNQAESAEQPAEYDPFAKEAKDAPLDSDFDNVWTHDSGGSDQSRAPARQLADSEFSFEQTLAATTSLRDHLLGQVQCDFHEPAERMIGVALVEMLDESGYLPADLELMRTQLGAPPALFAQIIERLQCFDPPGIFARSLKECLAVQLREQNRLDPAMQTLLDNLDLVASRDFRKLQQLCGVDAEDVADMVAELKRLNPRPAQAFANDAAPTVIPDVLLRPVPGGGWHVELNQDSLPRVLANETYYARVSAAARAAPEKTYLQERWQQANWLIKALHQRATTILKTAAEIVRQQENFFVYGVAQLRPMTLKQIAEAIGMHESTVSRVTTSKYIATPRGIFELKYFFSNALGSNEGGESHAAEAVRHKIRKLIAAETPGHVLADEDIAALLQKDGIAIARRTVAKYREALHIPSSAARKRALR